MRDDCSSTRNTRCFATHKKNERNKESAPERDTKRDEDERAGNEKPSRDTATLPTPAPNAT